MGLRWRDIQAAGTPEALPGGPESSDVRVRGSLAGHAYEKNLALAYCGSSFGDAGDKSAICRLEHHRCRTSAAAKRSTLP